MALDPKMPVLVVDDYSTMVRIIRNLLRQLGFEDIDDASDGSAALEKMTAKRYGLVISDWNMEPMTGYDLLRRVRANPQIETTPFIMVTAESKTENVIAAKKAGVNNYIVKPFNAQTLKAKIEAVFAEKTEFTSAVEQSERRDLRRRPGAAQRPACAPNDRPLTHQTSARITAFGATPAALKIALSAARSGASREPYSSAWMPEVTNI